MASVTRLQAPNGYTYTLQTTSTGRVALTARLTAEPDSPNVTLDVLRDEQFPALIIGPKLLDLEA